MTSTFRLTRAEFKKIFKRASVYIMALLLVVAVLISMYIFQPVSNESNTINYGDNLTVENYYDYFYNKDLDNSKKGLDTAYYNNADNIYNYFEISSDRDLKLTQNYNDIISSYNAIKQTTDSSVRNVKYNNELKIHIEAFYNNFQDFSMFGSNYNHIPFTSSSEYYLNKNCANIKFVYEKSKDDSISADDMITIIDTNDCLNKMKSDLDSAINYIRPTLYSMALEIKEAYNNFNTEYNQGSKQDALVKMEINRKALLTATNKFKEYFEILVDYDFPIITIAKSTKTEIINNLDIAIESLDSSVFNGTVQKYTDYSSLHTSLTNIDIANYFTKKFMENTTTISQVKLKPSILDEFEKVKNKVNSNKEAIENDIKSKRTDESIKNIQKSITNYSLLGQTYLNYLNDKIKISLNSEYRSDELVQLYGYKFNEFNIYEAQENITTYKYYIDNNIYSNSFNNNFTLMQSSKDEPNAFEFMYFAMEICTVLIIIFAMMMICNLITSETESGTIKLLLTRPYKRSKIITAKLFATIFFVLIFVLFSALISFAGGYFVYGLDMSNILVIFNSTSAFEISPIVLMLINIGTLLLDILFYVLIALMISILFKNYAGSISFCFVLIIATYALNMLFGGSFWYSLLPGPNLHLFKYLGNSFIFNSSNILQTILITPIQSTMNMWYSLLIVGAYSIVAIAISYAVFNKRDF